MVYQGSVELFRSMVILVLRHPNPTYSTITYYVSQYSEITPETKVTTHLVAYPTNPNARPIFGRPYYRSSLWYSISSVCRLSVVCLSSVCNVLYCGKTVRPSEKVSEGVNRKPGSKSSFFGSPPYFYFRFRLYSHRDGRFWLIFYL